MAEEFEEALQKKKKNQNDLNRLPKYIYFIPERKGLGNSLDGNLA